MESAPKSWMFRDNIREFKIPQRERQRQLENLFLCFPAEKLTAKAYHKRLIKVKNSKNISERN